jgi:hypothetical protein
MPRLAMSLIVRDEVELISSNIEFHAAHGVDVFVVMDNASIDGTRERLEQLKGDYEIEIVDQPSAGFLQGKWATELAELARHKHKADYIISNDADEFWSPKTGSLKDHLQQPVVKVPRTNMLPLRRDILQPDFRFYQSNLNVIRPTVSSRDLDRTLPEYPMMLRRMPAKVMCKLDGLKRIGFGNHTAVHETGAPVKANAIHIYHFPVRPYDDFARHVAFDRERLRDAPQQRHSGWHKIRWLEQLEQGALKAEWEKFSLDEAQVSELESLGVISRDETIKHFFAGA